MSEHNAKSEQVLLKNLLFSREKIILLGEQLTRADPQFKTDLFLQYIFERIEVCELKQRIYLIRDTLHLFLPSSYEHALNILLSSLPRALENTNGDGDFGDFIYAPHSEYIAKYGCERHLLTLSFSALEFITQRFSSEFALREFFQKFPQETLKQCEAWAHSPYYHVRRLASEGSRPSLPWGSKIPLVPGQTYNILEALVHDKSPYVRRSVANHLHDIAKKEPPFTYDFLQKHILCNEQTPVISAFVKHSLRSLLKKGDAQALEIMGIKPIHIQDVTITLNTHHLHIGDVLIIDIHLTLPKGILIRSDMIIEYPSKSGAMRRKTYSLREILSETEILYIYRKEITLKHYSTRKLFPGKHLVSIQINGEIRATTNFTLE